MKILFFLFVVGVIGGLSTVMCHYKSLQHQADIPDATVQAWSKLLDYPNPISLPDTLPIPITVITLN